MVTPPCYSSNAFQQGCLPLPPSPHTEKAKACTPDNLSCCRGIVQADCISFVNSCVSTPVAARKENESDRHLLVSAAAAGKKMARSNNKTVIRMKACRSRGRVRIMNRLGLVAHDKTVRQHAQQCAQQWTQKSTKQAHRKQASQNDGCHMAVALPA